MTCINYDRSYVDEGRTRSPESFPFSFLHQICSRCRSRCRRPRPHHSSPQGQGVLIQSEWNKTRMTGTQRRVLSFVDVHHAHLCSQSTHTWHVALPGEPTLGRSKVVLLKRSMYGCRDARLNGHPSFAWAGTPPSDFSLAHVWGLLLQSRA